MSFLGLLGGDKIVKMAMPMLVSHMRKNNIAFVMLSVKPNASSESANEDDFDVKFFHEPMAVISFADLEKYHSAINKCLENGIEY